MRTNSIILSFSCILLLFQHERLTSVGAFSSIIPLALRKPCVVPASHHKSVTDNGRPLRSAHGHPATSTSNSSSPSPTSAPSAPSAPSTPSSSSSDDEEEEDKRTTIQIGNLPFSTPTTTLLPLLSSALPPPFTIEPKPLRQPLRPRDHGKFHGGSARITFPTHIAAVDGMERLTRAFATEERDGGGGGIDGRLSRVKWAYQSTYVEEEVSEEEEEEESEEVAEERRLLRIERAEQYARRRRRVGERTDRVLRAVLSDGPGGGGGEGEGEGRTMEDMLGRVELEVLPAPTLDWTESPMEIDPVAGGGLQASTPRGERKRAAVEAFLFLLRNFLLEDDGDDGGDGGDGDDDDDDDGGGYVADLGCGAGNLSLPLAWWLRTANLGVLGIDYHRPSLERLKIRAGEVPGIKLGDGVVWRKSISTLEMDLRHLLHDDDDDDCDRLDGGRADETSLKGCRAIVSLHACGTASDLAMEVAVGKGLPFAISPCCIGKVLRARGAFRGGGGDRVRAGRMPPINADDGDDRGGGGSGVNNMGVSYPRSVWLKSRLSNLGGALRGNDGDVNGGNDGDINGGNDDDANVLEAYRLLAAAADYGPVIIGGVAAPGTQHDRIQNEHGDCDHNDTEEEEEEGSSTGITKEQQEERTRELERRVRCRLAKRIVEADRLEWAREREYTVRMLELPRIGPTYPKRELLLGARTGTSIAARIECLHDDVESFLIKD